MSPPPFMMGNIQGGIRQDEEAQKDWAIIPVDSLDILEGSPSGVSAPLEEGIPARGPNVDKIGKRSPLGVAAAPLPPSRPVDTISSRRRLPDQVLLSMYVPPYEGSTPRSAWLPLI